MKEQDYQKKVVTKLEARGAYTVKVVAASKKGVPDVVACVPFTKAQVLRLFENRTHVGIFIGAEIKTPETRANVSKLQEYNLRKIDEAGGISGVVVSYEDMEEFLGDYDES